MIAIATTRAKMGRSMKEASDVRRPYFDVEAATAGGLSAASGDAVWKARKAQLRVWP
jgi:hypothetical protein